MYVHVYGLLDIYGLVDAYSFWANRVDITIINITKYSYIIGKAIQLHFKWYITLNDDVINTDVVDYI